MGLRGTAADRAEPGRCHTDEVSDPVPQRVGDAERDRAAEYLREHMSVGRLTQDEFEERLSAALQARTVTDLAALFVDLPPPKPGQEVVGAGAAWPRYPAAVPVPAPSAGPPVPRPRSSEANLLAVVSAIVWPAWIVLCFAVGWHLWWLVFIPIVVSSLAGKRQEELKRQDKLWRQQQNPQLPPRSDGDPGSDPWR